MSVMTFGICVGCNEETDDFADLICDDCKRPIHEECGNRVDLPIQYAGTIVCPDCK